MNQCEYIKQLEERIKKLENNLNKSTAVQVVLVEAKQNLCEECVYFNQHYGRTNRYVYKGSAKADDGQYYFKLGAGHCTGSSRMKTKSPTDKACNNFKMLQRGTSNG